MTIRNVQPPDDKAEAPADLELFARVEGLVGEALRARTAPGT